MNTTKKKWTTTLDMLLGGTLTLMLGKFLRPTRKLSPTDESLNLDSYIKELDTIAEEIGDAGNHLETHNIRFINLLPKLTEHSVAYFAMLTQVLPFVPTHLVEEAKKEVEKYNNMTEEFAEAVFDMSKAQGEWANAYKKYMDKVAEAITFKMGQ